MTHIKRNTFSVMDDGMPKGKVAQIHRYKLTNKWTIKRIRKGLLSLSTTTDIGTSSFFSDIAQRLLDLEKIDKRQM